MNDHAPIPPPPNAPATVSEDPRDRPAWTQLGMFRGLPGESLRELRAAMTEVNFDAGARSSNKPLRATTRPRWGSVRVKVGNNRETVFDRLLNAPALVGEWRWSPALRWLARARAVAASTAARSSR